MTNHPTADLARFCASLQNEDLPATVRERVRYLLLDHLAVTIREISKQLPFLVGKNARKLHGPH